MTASDMMQSSLEDTAKCFLSTNEHSSGIAISTEILAQSDLPLQTAELFDIFCIVGPDKQEIRENVELCLTRSGKGLSNEPIPVRIR